MKLPKEKLEALKFDYIAGKVTLPKLAKIYGISPATLANLVNSERWPKRSPEKSRPVKKKPPGKKGRPSKMTARLLRLTYKLCLLGAKDREIWEALEISKATFYEWQNTYKNFSDVLAQGRIHADAAVARALHKRAVGFTASEEKPMVVEGVVKKVRFKKRYIPDVTAQVKWLERRRPDEWRESKDLNLNDKTLRVELPAFERVETEEDFRGLVNEQVNE